MLSEKSPVIQDTLGIANEYLTGEADVIHAADRLTGNGPFGLFVAGEILLDEATKKSGYPPEELFDLAKVSYHQVMSLTKDACLANGEHLSTRARTLARLAQFPALRPIYTEAAMPQSKVVRDMYKRLVRQSNAAIDILYGTETRSNSESAIELYGLVGELAVLTLAQRAYVAKKIQRLALHSMFSEDHGSSCILATETYTWDVNTFTNLRPKDNRNILGIVRKNTIQIRSAKRDDNEALGPTLYIRENLALYSDERSVGLKIIRHCGTDEIYNRAKGRINSLDDRTDRLVHFLDTTEQITPLH
jgi:phosphoglycolate phosphatase-like HAD superfamily hydrolase